MEKQEIEIIEGKVIETYLINTDQIEHRFGFVAMIDALGTKNNNLEDLKKYLDNLNIVIKSFVDLKEYHNKIFFNDDDTFEKPKFEIFTFQDTVILSLDVKEENKLVDYLNYFSTLLQYFVAGSFIGKVMYRGAVSYGNYWVYENKYYFGDAINDAAEWYEFPDLIGVISTPKYTNYLNYVNELMLEKEINSQFITKERFNELYSKSNFPGKNNVTLNTWLCNWPVTLALHSARPEDKIDRDLNALGFYYAIVKTLNIPKGTESKYQNTRLFVENIFKLFPGYLQIKRPYPFEEMNDYHSKDILL